LALSERANLRDDDDDDEAETDVADAFDVVAADVRVTRSALLDELFGFVGGVSVVAVLLLLLDA